MTERELLIAMASYDAMRLAEAFAPLTEAERKGLRPNFTLFNKLFGGFAPLRRDTDSYGPEYPYLDELARDSRWMLSWNCALGALALGTLTDAKRVKMFDFSGVLYLGKDAEGAAPNGYIPADCWDAMVRVLSDRRPEWADAWLAHLLDDRNSTLSVRWLTLQRLIQIGVVRKPVGVGYHRAMAAGIASLAWRFPYGDVPGKSVISDHLRANPELIEDVYSLFFSGSHNFLSGKDGWDESHRGGEESWARAMRRLAEEGLLDRMRLLRASLAGLMEDFKAHIVAGLSDFHEGMNPTPDELAVLQGDYYELLSNETEHVVAFAIKMLRKVDAEKALDEAAYVHAAIPVLERKGKGLVKAVLTQFQKIGVDNPELAAEIMAAVAERGLGHPDRDVQEASLKLLEKWKSFLTSALRDQIATHAEEMAATLRERARTLTASAGDVGGTNTKRIAKSKPKAASRSRRKAQTSEGASPSCQETGRVGVPQSAEASLMPPPLEYDPLSVPRLSGLTPVVPVATSEELLELVARYIENRATALDAERIMDGIGRLDIREANNFDRMAAPLALRLKEEAGGLHGLLNYWLRRDATYIALSPQPPHVTRRKNISSLKDFRFERTREIGERLETAVYLPMLSLPTHSGGWIDPQSLIDRLEAWATHGLGPGKYDFIQALLRLAPDGRAEAATRLENVQGDHARLLYWVLSAKGRAKGGDDVDLWLAASRARDPRGEVAVPGLDASGLVGPDGRHPATYSWITETRRQEIRDSTRRLLEPARDRLEAAHGELDKPSSQQAPMADIVEEMEEAQTAMDQALWVSENVHHALRECLLLEIQPGWVLGDCFLGRPTIMLHNYSCRETSEDDISRDVEWASMTWPLNRDAFFAAGLAEISITLDWDVPASDYERGFVVPLFEPEQPLTLPAVSTLCRSLFVREGDLSRTAIDVLIETIADGRAHPGLFAEALPRCCATEYFKPGRMAKYLAEISRVSPLHTWVVTGMVQSIVASWSTLPKNAHHLLELLLESLAQLGEPLDASVVKRLSRMKCSGKSAKIAKELLALEAKDNGVMDSVREAMLAARIARAKRWAAAESKG